MVNHTAVTALLLTAYLGCS